MKERTYSFFKMNRLILVLLCLFFATNIYAQNREIRGMVTGDDNEPLAGATITIKNRQGGIIVDIDGKFTIKAKTGEILVVSFLGMKKQEVKIDNKDFYAIKLLPETNEFDEVTVVAFAKQKKESVISAVSTVNPQELKVPSSNLTTALAGRMSGLIAFQTSGEPGKDNAQFFVRGATTFGYKKDPLILIDNIELSTDDLARLNVDDIAQFSIMKDATATALYGARGANGVILVTTKQGTAGRPKVSVRVEQSVSTPRKKVKLTDPVNFMKLNNEAVNSRRDPNNPAASANYTVYSQEKIENTIAGTNPYYYPAVDWYDELFNDYALSTRVNANLSGGGSAVRYYVAASYTKDGGVIKNDKLNNYNSNINWQRYSVRSNINMDLSKTTEFAIRVNGNFDDYTGPLDSGEGLYKKVMKTSPVLYPKSYPATDEYANNTHVLFGNANKGAYINPYADMVRGYKESNNLLVAAQAELKQKLDFITQGLDARVLVSTTRSSYSDLTRAINPYYYQANYDKTNNSYTLTNIVEGEEYLSYNQGAKNINTTNYIEAAVSYGRTFGAHATSGMLVYTRREEKRSSEKTLQQSLPRRNQGIAGRFTYAYDSRYFAEFNFGYNGSERFAVPIEFLTDFASVLAQRVAVGRRHFLGDVAANGHSIPRHIRERAASAGGIGAGEIVIHAGDLDDRARKTSGGIIRVHLADLTGGGDGGGIRKGDRHGAAAVIRQDDIFRPRVVDLVAVRSRRFCYGVGSGVQGREGIGAIRAGDDVLGEGAVGGFYVEPRSGEALGGVGGVHLLDHQLVLLVCDGKTADHNVLDGAGRMCGRASAGEGILFYVAIAPNILLAQIQDIFRPVPECGAVAGLVDAGIARALQRVPDVHQFLRAGSGGITQGAVLIPPHDGLYPGVHVPAITGIPDVIYAKGVGLVREDAEGVGVVIGHHHFDGGIGDGLRIAPGLTDQRGAHAAALRPAKAHGGLSGHAVIHLVHCASAKAGGLIGNAAHAEPL